jgi:hypothetical protein
MVNIFSYSINRLLNIQILLIKSFLFTLYSLHICSYFKIRLVSFFIFSVINSPTPHYNSIITYDLTTLKTNIQNIKMIKEYPNIRDAIILLKIWLKQQEFSNNFETFNGHIITMYVLYLLYIKKLNTFMSSYQIVRNTWQYLGNYICDKSASIQSNL